MITTTATPLGDAYAALDATGTAWARLRDAEPAGRCTEVDLLVAPGDLPQATGALARAGFVPLAARGLGTHRFFVTYDTGADRWLKLDIVTELAFGRRRDLRVVTANRVLASRIRSEAAWTLAPGDDFWALTLHCLLDRGAVPPRHRALLTETAGGAGASALRAAPVEDRLADRVISAALACDEPELVRCATPLRRSIVLKHPWAVSARLVRGRARALGAKLGLPPRPGLVVALIGPDGSGKSTLAAGLQEVLPIRTRVLYGGLFARRRQGSLGRGLQLAGFACSARYQRRRGTVVIADRHPLESPTDKPGLRGAARRWLMRTVPDPDLALVLDCDGNAMFQRKGEHSPAALEDQRQRFRDVAAGLPRSAVLDTRRSSDVVRASASLAIWECLKERWG
jgi:thymidylate kinase